MSVRTRLALWYGVALLVVVSIYAGAVFFQVHDDLYESLDGQLEGDQALALQWLSQRTASPADAGAALTGGSAESRPDVPWVDAWNADGRRLFDAGSRPALPPPPGPPSTWAGGPHSMTLDSGGRVRVLVRSARLRGDTVLVRVGRSEQFARQELAEFGTSLALSLPVAFAIAAGAAFLLARRALAPVAAMTSRARQITADRLDARLPVENPDDEFGQLAGVVNDLLGRLEKAFRTLRRFTADASHEFRTPLTAIRSVGEVGLRGHRGEAEYREIIGSVLEEVERLTSISDSLLLLSRADSGKTDLQPSTVDLAELAREVAGDLEVLADEKHIRVTVEPKGPATVVGDRGTLRHAVINLLDNAIKYSPEGSAIRMVAKTAATQSVLEVIDAGPGIEARHLPYIFDRFYRVDQSRSRNAAGGVGLGLSIAVWGVEANGGRIEVESEVDRGSVFRVVLPRAAS